MRHGVRASRARCIGARCASDLMTSLYSRRASARTTAARSERAARHRRRRLSARSERRAACWVPRLAVAQAEHQRASRTPASASEDASSSAAVRPWPDDAQVGGEAAFAARGRGRRAQGCVVPAPWCCVVDESFANVGAETSTPPEASMLLLEHIESHRHRLRLTTQSFPTALTRAVAGAAAVARRSRARRRLLARTRRTVARP